jgi:hypothetical protein
VSKSLGLQYEDEGTFYSLFAVDSPIVYASVIYKVTLPDFVSASYTQVQNDADKADFENNYKATANGRLTTALSGTAPVSIANWPAFFGVTGSVNTYTSGLQGVSGTVTAEVGNWPLTMNVSASAGIRTYDGGTQGVSGSVNSYTSGLQGVSGTVQVWSEGPLPVSGTVAVTNWPAIVGVSGSVGVTNFPAVQAVSGSQLTGSTFSGYPVMVGGAWNSGSQVGNAQYVKALAVDASGSVYVTTSGSLPVHLDSQVSVANFPATQNVSGAVALTNWPATIGVSGTVVVTQTGSFHVTVDNSELAVSNFPATQNVSGTVNIGNWPLTMNVSASAGIRVIQQGIIGVSGTITVTPPTGSAGTQVQGLVASGSTVQGNPVFVAGVDNTGVERAVLTDTLGRIITAPAGAATTYGEAFANIALNAIVSNTFVSKTTYTEQTGSAVVRAVVSTSTADVNATGTGAWQVTITYYDQNYNGPFTETVNLNGTTRVATVSTTMCFIEKMQIAKVGSGGVTAGTISLLIGNYTGASTLWSITAGDNQTFAAHHYTPAGKTTYITGMGAGINGGGASFFLKTRASGSNSPEIQVTELLREAPQAATTQRIYNTPIQAAGPGRIRCYLNTEANTSLDYRGSFDFYDQ